MLRWLTAGESHGPALTVVVEGLPAGLPVTVEQIGDELARRRLGFGIRTSYAAWRWTHKPTNPAGPRLR